MKRLENIEHIEDADYVKITWFRAFAISDWSEIGLWRAIWGADVFIGNVPIVKLSLLLNAIITVVLVVLLK